MKKSEVSFGLLRLPIDALAVCTALLLSYHLRFVSVDLIPGIQLLEQATTLPPVQYYFDTFVVPGIFLFITLSTLARLYVLRSYGSLRKELIRVFLVSVFWVICVIAWFFLVRKQLFYSRILLAHAGFFLTVFVSLGRIAVRLLQRSFLRMGHGVYSVMSFGSVPLAVSAQHVFTQDLRYKFVGHSQSLDGVRIMHPDIIVQTDPNPKAEDTLELIAYCRNHHIDYAFLPPVFADVPQRLRIEHVGLLPVLYFQPTPLDGWGRVVKRVFDFFASLCGILILLPLFIVVGICIVLMDGFPIFYVSKRIGEGGKKTIPVLKFRTMKRNADDIKEELLTQSDREGPLFKMKHDPRVTRLGHYLRRWDIDELPQLFNVLVGHMSLVGPRPHIPEEVSLYREDQRRVFAVPPGITGMGQISGRSNIPFEEEVKQDLHYIEEWSMGLDIVILWKTVGVVLMPEHE